MKKTIIACMILSALNGVAAADAPSYTDPNSTNNKGQPTTSPANATSTPPTTVDSLSPAATTSTPSTINTTTTPSDAMTPANQPGNTMTATPTTPATAPMPAAVPTPIDCNYQLSPQITQVDPQLIKTWTEKAVEQSFTFDSTKLDQQIEKLKSCYTPQGWQGFYDALKKSGNLTAITNQGLSVSAMIDGQTSITQNKQNEWKLSTLLNVVYQNKQQKLTQTISMEVIVGRKPTGDLGIMQIVAVPKNANEPASPAASTPAAEPTDAKPADMQPRAVTPSSATPNGTSSTSTPNDSTPGEMNANDTDAANMTSPKNAEPATAQPAGTPSVNPPLGTTP